MQILFWLFFENESDNSLILLICNIKTSKILMEEVPPNFIHLQPFIHQVGGHSSMLCLDEATVCKPLVPRELEFYETIPDSLKKFVPRFHGVIKVKVVQDLKGYVKFIASPPANYKPIISNGKRTLRLRRSGSIEVEGEHSEIFLEDHSDEGSSLHLPTALNPWVFKCHQNQLKQLIEHIDSEETSNFIVLENLTTNFLHPCILDLKMGTRQYGDTDTLLKKQSKMYKVVSTTSGKLGVRIGGMQVYQVSSNRYLCRNKFYGRSLSVSGFQQALKQFLHNGITLRSDVLTPLIRRLEELLKILSSQDAIRFYTTSLLLLYEGATLNSTTVYDFDVSKVKEPQNDLQNKMYILNSNDKTKTEIVTCNNVKSSPDVVAIVRQESIENYKGNSIKKAIVKQNSANTDTKSNPERKETSGVNSPQIKLSPSSSVTGETVNSVNRSSSAETLTDFTDEYLDEYLSQAINKSFITRRRSSSATRVDESKLSRSSSFNSTPLDSPRPVEPLVDIRIIDFAHSTHKGLNSPVVYSGPDKGFLFGLENMISCLKSIQSFG